MAKIAIVDDSRLARTFTATVLRRLGHEVEEIDPASIFEVVRMLKEVGPDLLVMDFLMPNCPGMSLARVCREEAALAGMRILVITAHHDEEVATRLTQMGVAGILYKPVEAAGLAEQVGELLG
ncbi:response regulator [Mesoterricola sediminis]|nr:response regulator [Mesoterricola sediminis]